MMPLIDLGFTHLNSYAFFMACGFWLGFIYFVYFVKSRKINLMPENEMIYLFAAIFIFAIFGAKAAYVIAERRELLFENILNLFKFWESGFVYYGGLIGAIVCIALYLTIKKVSFKTFCDIFAPALCINVFFIRIGCFFAGCCYGRETSLPWGIKFTGGAPLHPAQIYEALAAFALFLFLHFYNKKHFGQGKTLSLYLMGYALARFIIEFFRGDERGGYFLAMSPSQNISIAMFILGLVIFTKAEKCQKK
ncbi:MAG: prolipoprotein diacylglyceryl transferase [Endomicrobium sp.]|jgi:phosphatidylglycerol:prolipoprotein diacylglycerol transferase|nr:prolipoprotein diacylglyceryl transferase [Endomicrobium sp.]